MDHRRHLNRWDRQNPVDAWECERAKRIETIQGSENLVVKAACEEAGLWR